MNAKAIKLYEKAFNTEVSEIMRFGDMPQDPENPMPIPDSQKNWILQATLPFGDNFMRMSDSFREINEGTTERIGIVVESSVETITHAFKVLAEEGNVDMPLGETFFSPAYVP